MNSAVQDEAEREEVPSLKAQSIVHDYSGVVVLHDVGFQLRGGEIHALLGQNGSGKSTLIKVLTGAVQPTRGQLWLNDQKVVFSTPRDSQNAGVSVVHQNYNLFPDMSVEHNLLAGSANPPRRRLLFNTVDHNRWRRRVQETFDRLQKFIDPTALVSSLGPAERKFVEIARAMLLTPQFLILDEPTAALEPEAAEQVLGLMQTLRSQGVGVALVSHRLEEVIAVADEVSVLRDGRLVANRPAEGLSSFSVSELMTGQALKTPQRASSSARAEVRLRLENVTVGGPRFDLDVRAGEIVAVSGLIGSGASTIVSMAGGDVPVKGRVEVDGKPVNIRTPRDAYRAGIGFIPEDRKSRGLVMDLSSTVNISLASLEKIATFKVVQGHRLNERAKHYRNVLQIKMNDPSAAAATLSGGNQQKILVAKLLAAGVGLMAIEEPTQGVDIGGRAQIHQLLRDYVTDGGAVLLFSTDSAEVLNLADTVCIFRHGELTHRVPADDFDERSLVSLVGGGDLPASAI